MAKNKFIQSGREAFSLIEVLIAVAVLSTAIIFIFRSFVTSLSAARISQDITLACLLVEEKYWLLEQREKDKISQDNYYEEDIVSQGKKFHLKYEIKNTNSPGLKELDLSISWQEKKEKPYVMEFSTYLTPQG